MRLLWIALALIVASALAVGVTNHSLIPAIASPPSRPLRDVPLSLGAWIGEELELDLRIFVSTGAADVVTRTYRNPIGDQISILVGTWLDYQVYLPHSPVVCYPSAGWDIVSQKQLNISLSDGQSFTARLLTLDQHGQQLAVLYWFYLGPEVVLEDGDVRRAMQTSRRSGKARPPLIKVILQTAAEDVGQAERRLVDLAGALAHSMQEMVR